uniref:BZIP domain-containing protein n=1 Tax=Anopheles minimus TaxID=112268 RepID=A0A182VVQ7_9DIPT
MEGGDVNNFLFNQDDWPEEDFMSLLKMDDTMLFSEPSTNNIGASDELDDIMRQLNCNYTTETCLGEQQVTSPLSSDSSSDQDFHGFNSTTDGSNSASLDGYFDEGYGVRIQDSPSMKQEQANVNFNMLNLLEPSSPTEQEVISSAASDSGLSSDHLDLDPNPEFETLSPRISSPSRSMSERGGPNSPHRFVKSVQNQCAEAPQIMQHVQLASESVMPQPNFTGHRTTQTMVPFSTEKLVTKTIVTNASSSMNSQPMKTPLNKMSKTEHLTGVKSLVGAGNGPKRFVASTNNSTTATSIVPSASQQLANKGKELKIIRMATMKNGQTVAVASGLTATSTTTGNKKVTLQLKNSSANVKTAGVSNTIIPKNVVLTSSSASLCSSGTVSNGRKFIRMQQQLHQNGRQILVPVTIQDLRTIKIVNSTNMKNKSSNIQLAAANMLQQSKQGLIQKNVILSKDQLLVEDVLSDAAPSSSDSESYVFEDIMEQSNSVIAEVERQQKHIISDSDVEPDGDDCDDDDVDMDDIDKGRNQNGSYQKLMLTAEEKRLLAKEGISLPTSYPLTKHEERELKRIRRKIRNKISAQDSRKRKKEYVDGLEERVKQCTEENQNLVKRIKILQSQNHDLVSQMKRIQSLLTKGTSKTTQPATCLMVLLISMALVAVPNLKLGNTATQQNIQDSIEMSELMQDVTNDKLQVQQSRRSLLFDTKEQTHASDEELNFDEIMSSFNANSLIANEHDYFSEADDRSGNEPPLTKRSKLLTTTLIDYDVDDDVWNGGNKVRVKQEAGSMSPDSSSSAIISSNNELFEQKVREFQSTLQKTNRDGENGIAENFFVRDDINSQVIVDHELFDLVGKQNNGLHEMNFDIFSGLERKSVNGIDLFAVRPEPTVVVNADSTAGDANEVRKMNASQQIHQQNNKRKLLL